MIKFFATRYRQWKELLKERKFRRSLGAGILLFIAAYIANYEAVLYTNEIQVLTVGDLILDNIPTVDLSLIYVFGIYLVAAIVTFYPFLFKPALAPFTLKTVSAFIIIRAFFISLTHLGAPANFFNLPQFVERSDILRIFYTNDLFFSGHTGFPFLAALIFWETKWLRRFLILMSIAQATTVLFMHVHYSIDVFSAYFITYSIYIVSHRIFKDLNLSFRRIVERLEENMRKLKASAQQHLNPR